MRKFIVVLFFLFSFNKVYAKLNVSSTIYPIYLIAQSVGGDNIDNNLIIKNGTSPHTFSPKPSTSKTINNSDIIFYIDESFEVSLRKFFKGRSNTYKLIKIDNLKIISSEDCQEDSTHEHSQNKNNHHHDVGHDHNHHHDSLIDLHIWLNTDNSKLIAEYMAKVFIEKDSKNKDVYLNNLKKFIDDMDILKKTLEVDTKIIKNLSWTSYHNAYNYFIDEFNLKRPVTLTYNPEKSLSGKNLLTTRNKIKNNNVTCMINEPEFNNSVSKNIAKELNLKVFNVSPLGDDKKDKKYSNIFIDISNTLTKCVK